MQIATHRHMPSTGIAGNEAILAEVPADMHADQDHDLKEITDLAERFKYAHARLNNIELELHENLQSGDRLALLRNLEEARMDYSDARFALSTRNVISSKR